MRAETSLVSWFGERLEPLQVREDTRAYIVGVLNDFRHAENDLSQVSLVLEYFEAVKSGEFQRYQRLGDWILFSEALFPTEHNELTITLGRQAYGQCWRILKGKWVLYDELADRLPEISKGLRILLIK